jgi:hypothetical protein
MKRRNKRKKLLKKVRNTIVFLLLISFFFYYVNQTIIFKPFLAIQGEGRLVVVSRNWINANFKSAFITKKSIINIQPSLVDKTISSLKLRRKFFLVWSLIIQQKIGNRYIFLNDQIRVLDEDSNLVDISINQEEIKKQIPFLLKIEILEQVPIKSKEQNEKNNDQSKVIKTEKNVLTEVEIFSIYQNELKPFVEYLYKSDSSLGPKISLIQFFPKEGLRFFLFDKIYWIGKQNNYSQLETNIGKFETYLKKKNKIQLYNEFDLRYENRIICRNNQ